MDPAFSAAFEESIDVVFNSIAHDFAKSKCLEKVNSQLREEVATLSKDIEKRSHQLLSKDTEILSLNNKIIALTEQRSELISNIDKEMNAQVLTFPEDTNSYYHGSLPHQQALLVKTTYDVRYEFRLAVELEINVVYNNSIGGNLTIANSFARTRNSDSEKRE